MKYIVDVSSGPEKGLIASTEVSGESAAKKLAMEMCKKHPSASVYVSFFRSADGQHGYLNWDGHNPVGTDWNK